MIHSSKNPPFYISSTLLLVTVTDSHRLDYQWNNSSEMLIEIHNYIFDISARKT